MRTAVFSAGFENLDSIRNFVGQAAEEAGFSSKEVYSIQLAVDEGCSNVIEHAYEGVPDGEIEITCEAQADRMVVIIHDHGREFDISKVRKPNLSRELSEREVGGLGVYLMRKLMDEVHFESSCTTGNYLTLVKRKSGET